MLRNGLHVPSYYRRDHPIEIIDPLKMPPLPDVGRMPPMQCAVAYITSVSGTSGGTSITLPNLSVTAGDTVIVSSFSSSVPATLDVTAYDAAGGNVLTVAVSQFTSGAGNVLMAMWSIAVNNTSTLAITTTVSSAANWFAANAYHYSGIALTSALDKTSTSDFTATVNMVTGTTPSVTAVNEAMVAGFAYTSIIGSGPTIGTGWSNGQFTGTGFDTYGEQRVEAAASGGYEGTATLSASRTGAGMIATFKAAAAGATGFGQPLGGRRNNPVAMMG